MLQQLACKLRLDLLMVQEVSIILRDEPPLKEEQLGNGWTLYHTTADERGRGGIGVVVNPRLRQLVCCESLSPRLLRVDLHLRSRNAHLFCAYAPTASHPEEAGRFFDFLAAELEATAQRDTLVVLGDLNAVMRKSNRAPFVTVRENANTDALVDLVERLDLVSANTRFRKPAARLATFAGCKRRRRNATGTYATRRLAQLDHILLRYRERGRVKNCDTVRPLALGSDHKLLVCDLRLRDPLYRPPRKPPRRYFRGLQDILARSRFSKAFDEALDGKVDADYSDVCAAIHAAARDTLPLARPRPTVQMAWMEEAVVRNAQRAVERLRRRGQNAKEAERRLAAVCKQRQQAAVDEAIRTVTTAPLDRKARIAWSAINTLTGRKQRTAVNLTGDTPDQRRNELRDFLASAVNALPPLLPASLPLPPGTALPADHDFCTAPFTVDAIIRAAKRTPGGKATGPDEVPVEALRIHRVASEVTRGMNSVLETGVAPKEWTYAHIVAIPKKPGTRRKEEHRGISLMSCTAKLYNRLLLSRLQPVLDPYLRCEQNGFRPRRGTASQILALRRIIEEARIHQADLVCVFVDFSKAFDSVARDALPLVLSAYHVPQRLVAAVMALYDDTKAAVVTPDGLSDKFGTSSGVLQGDTLAPFLFVLVLDWVLRTGLPSSDDGFLLCGRTSSRHPEKRLAVLAYADDLVLLASSAAGAQRLVDGLTTAATRVGLAINTRKTEVLTVPKDLPADINCSAAVLPRSNQFRYLGGLVPGVLEDLRRRRGLAWAAFRSIRVALQSDALPDQLRGKLFAAVVETVLLYNAETWTLTATLEKQLNAAHSGLLRAAFSVRRQEPTTNRALYQRAGLQVPSQIVRLRRLKLVGHLVRAESYCPEPAQDVLFLELQNRRRQGQGRTRRYTECLAEDVYDLGLGGGTTRDIRRLALCREI